MSNKHIKNRSLLTVGLILSLYFWTHLSQAGSSAYMFNRTESEVILDGEITPREWKDSFQADINYEVSPGENIPAPVTTRVYLMYTEKGLYIAYKASDPDPGSIRSRLSDRDHMEGLDCVGVMLDTFNDKKYCYVFTSNPHGIQEDSILTDTGTEDISWDTIWKSAGKIYSKGYEVEMFIPFESITFPSTQSEQEWGASFFRVYPRKFRKRLYSNPFDRNNSCFLCDFNTVSGLKNIKNTRHIEINPSLVSTTTRNRNTQDHSLSPFEKSSRVSLNIRYSPVSDIIINSTFNPDFSQVEADAVQLDINRQFNLYYEEKRPFFLEESNRFNTLDPVFYSRIITDPSHGIKMTGKVGGYSFGGLTAKDTITQYIQPNSRSSTLITWDHDSTASVVRIQKDLFKKSSLGFIATNRSGGTYSNRLAGLDGRIYLSKANTFDFQMLYSKTENPLDNQNSIFNGNTSSGYSEHFKYYHDSRNWTVHLSTIRRDKGFRSDLGYITQVNLKKTKAYFGNNFFTKEGSAISEYQYRIEGSTTEDLDGNLLESTYTLKHRLYFTGQSYLLVYAGKKRELFQNSIYHYNTFTAAGRSRPLKELAFDFTIEGGQKIDYIHNRLGSFNSSQLHINYKPSVNWEIDLNLISEALDIHSNHLYSASVIEGKCAYNVSSRCFLRAIVHTVKMKRNQDLYAMNVPPIEKAIDGQLMLNYKINPRTLCYLGFSTGHKNNERNLNQTISQTIFFKISYAFSL